MKNYKRVRVANPNKFDKKSFRVKDVGRVGHTKLIIGCPRGKFDSGRKRCKVGTKVQAVIVHK